MRVLFDLDRVERLRTAVERASATVTSADHAVLVTVGAGGAITELELTNQAVRRGGHAVAALITDTVRRATADLAETLAAELDEFTDGRADPAALLSGALPAPQRPAQPAQSGQPAPPGHDDPEQAAEELPGSALMERLRTESARTLDGYAELRDELAELTTTARSPDGAITATVRSGGAIDTLHIDDSALRHGPGNLGRLVLATIQRARAGSALQAAERVQGLAGLPLSIRDMVESAIPPELRPDTDTDTDTDRATGGRR